MENQVLEYLSQTERLTERLDCSSQRREESGGSYQCVQTSAEVETTVSGDRLFSPVPSKNTAGKCHKLKYRKLHLNIYPKTLFFFFLNSGGILILKSAQFPSFQILKTQLDKALSNFTEIP